MTKKTLNEGQKAFVQAAITLEGKGLTLLGAGGTGKSLSIMAAVRVFLQRGQRVLLCGPTNRSVKELESAARQFGILDQVTTATIHKALGLALLPDDENKFTVKMGNSVLSNFDWVIIDEGSMISGIAVSKYIIPELTVNPHLKAIVLGDALQLPPVRETESPALKIFPVMELTKVERSQADSGVAKFNTALRKCVENKRPFTFNAEDYDITAIKPAEMDDYILQQFTTPDCVDHTRAMAWTNAQVDYINNIVREKIFGKGVAKFVVGERVTAGAPIKDEITGETILGTDEECIVRAVTKSSIMDDVSGEEYDTYYLTLDPVYLNIGEVRCHTLNEDSQVTMDEQLSKIAKRASKDRALWRRFHELKDLASSIKHCYAITIHRSQGSTFPHAIVDVRNLQRNRDRNMARRLLYVGSSRASEKLTLCRDQFTI